MREATAYDAEELWSVISATSALKESGRTISVVRVADWLEAHAGEEHACGEYGPVGEEKIIAILALRP